MVGLFSAISVVIGAYGLFRSINGMFSLPEAIRESNGGNEHRLCWSWRNTSVSFVHSFITAIWSLLCFVVEPKMLQDMIITKTPMSYLLLAFSSGYFLADLQDIVSHSRFRQLGLILHHLVVILAFSVAMVTKRYIGYGVCSLLMEVNSVFLHSRKLLNLAVVRRGYILTANAVALLVTFVCFRLMTSAWMVKWLHINRSKVESIPLAVGTIGMLYLSALNIVLFVQLWKKDFQRKVKAEKIS